MIAILTCRFARLLQVHLRNLKISISGEISGEKIHMICSLPQCNQVCLVTHYPGAHCKTIHSVNDDHIHVWPPEALWESHQVVTAPSILAAKVMLGLCTVPLAHGSSASCAHVETESKSVPSKELSGILIPTLSFSPGSASSRCSGR